MNLNPYILEGQVVDTSDPAQMGRVKVWIPALDGENFDIDQLPWAEYATPFAGFTVDFPAGGAANENHSQVAYGFWAIPKIGATVLIFCLNGDANSRFFFASTIRTHRNRSLPAGRNVDINGNRGPFGDSGDVNGNLTPIQPAYNNLRTQFAGKITSPQALSRGAYERQVAQGANNKDGTEGYAKSPVDASYLDPQTYCLVTPGRHALIFQDEPSNSRMRIKTAEGHQIIFDDANERIYLSTAKGNSWVELDQDGHIHVFGSESISFRTGKDFNVYADGAINLQSSSINLKAIGGNIAISAKGNVGIKANGSILQSACRGFSLESEQGMNISASSNLEIGSQNSLILSGVNGTDINGGTKLTLTGGTINLNGPKAKIASPGGCPEVAGNPSVVPGHEPWVRPTSAQARGPNWKP